MRNRHNKKRNTAFLYEMLIYEMTKAVVDNDGPRVKAITSILKGSFHKKSALGQELELYKSLYETRNLTPETAERVLQEVKRVYLGISQPEVFQHQSEVIKQVNKDLGSETFKSFVPNYKNLATIAQMFDMNTPLPKRVLLEEKVRDSMTEGKKDIKTPQQTLDSLSYRIFVKKFNDKYSQDLNESQKMLMNAYIVSHSDDSLSLKNYLNSELGRLKEALVLAIDAEEIKKDEKMQESARQVLAILEDFRNRKIDQAMIEQVLRTQKLVEEINRDDN